MKKSVVKKPNEDRVLQIIKKVAESYTTPNIVKTEVVVKPEKDLQGIDYYKLYPTFYVKGMMGPDFTYQRHLLAQYVEDVTGFPTHGTSARIKWEDFIEIIQY